MNEIKNGLMKIQIPCPDNLPGCAVAHYGWIPVESETRSIYDTDGSPFYGNLEKDQTWVKGNREKTIIHFDEKNVWYKTKDDIANGKMTRVKRNSFRAWITTGARLKGSE